MLALSEPQRSEDLYDKWVEQTLTVEDIVPKVTAYGAKILLNQEEIRSISRQIHKAYRKYHDPTCYAGEFIHALAGDSVSRVFSEADNLNERALRVYHYYFVNCAPGDWREKLR